MSSRRNLRSAVRCSVTTWRFLSSATAWRRNFISGAGLAVDVEDLLAPVDDGHQRVALVVLRHLLAVEHGDPEVQDARPGVGQREADAHGGRLAVGGQRDVLRRELLALVFHDERHDAARVAGLADHDVDDERRALQHRHRRIDAAQLDVVRERLAAEADREHRQAGRPQRPQRVGQARARRCRRRRSAARCPTPAAPPVPRRCARAPGRCSSACRRTMPPSGLAARSVGGREAEVRGG